MKTRKIDGFACQSEIDEVDYRDIKDATLDGEATYDSKFKAVFSYKEILAVVAKYTIPQLAKYSTSEIVKFIGNPSVNTCVEPSFHKLVTTESSIGDEAIVKYDIVTEIEIPAEEQSTILNVRFNVEMQRAENPGYNLGKRGVYYTARMISEQLPKVTADVNYDCLHPVYSVWIVLTTKDALKGTFVDYSMQPGSGESKKQLAWYNEGVNMQHIRFIFLDKDIDKIKLEEMNTGILEFLTLLFQDKLDNKKMERYVKVCTPNLRKDVEGMTAHRRELLEEREEGIAVGEAKNKTEIAKRMFDKGFTLEVISEITGISIEELKLLKK